MLALAAANFLTVQRHVRSTVDAESRKLVAAQARALGDWVEAKRLLTHTLTPAIEQPDPRGVVQALRDGGGFSDAHVGFPGKRTIFLNPMPDSYDVTSRPWYQQAVKEGKPILTTPYLFTSPPEVGVTFAEPVGPAGNPTAVVGTDVLLTTVVRNVAAIHPTPDSFAFLANRAAALVTHHDTALTLKPVSELSPNLQPPTLGELAQAGSGCAPKSRVSTTCSMAAPFPAPTGSW